MQGLLPYVINGISAGGQYALIAIGYTLVYGILRLINFAHGDVFMVAGLIMVYTTASMPMYISIPLVLIFTVILGFAIERVAYKPLRNVNAAHLVAVYAGGECYTRFSAAECVYIILGIYPVFFYGDCFHASSCQIALSTSIAMPAARYTAARAAKPRFALRLSVSACSAVSSKSSSVLCRGAFSPMRGLLRFSAGDLR